MAIVLDGYGFSESLLRNVSHPGTPVVLLDDLGHWIQMEAPEAVNQHLGAFLDSL